MWLANEEGSTREVMVTRWSLAGQLMIVSSPSSEWSLNGIGNSTWPSLITWNTGIREVNDTPGISMHLYNFVVREPSCNIHRVCLDTNVP